MTHPVSSDGYTTSILLCECVPASQYFRRVRNVIAILQVAVEDAIWILDVPALTESLEEKQWISLFSQLLCSEALKLGLCTFSTCT